MCFFVSVAAMLCFLLLLALSPFVQLAQLTLYHVGDSVFFFFNLFRAYSEDMAYPSLAAARDFTTAHKFKHETRFDDNK